MELGKESSKSNFEECKEEKRIETNRGEINRDHSELNLPVGEDKKVEETIEPPKVNGDGNGEKHKGELSPKSIGSSSNSNLGMNSAPTKGKGKGLKTWRRLRRDLNKDASERIDSPVILKRRLSLNEPPKARDDDNKVKNVVVGELKTPTPSGGSLRSIEAVEALALDPELVQLVSSSGFSIGMDSDNSEDRSSKSLMTASIPKPRHEIGFGRERSRLKNVGGRGGGNSLQQRTQGGRGSGVEASKKIRGNHIMLEKGNLQSSVESDLRSSNVGFMRWGSGSNGKHGDKSLNFDLEHGDEDQTCEAVKWGYYNENGVVEDLLRGDLDPDLLEGKKVKRENFRPPSVIDPFVEPIVMLRAVQEALEAEIQKIGEIGKATGISDLDDQTEETEVNCYPVPGAHLVELNQKIEHLQYKLDEASATVKAMELKVLELENIINRSHLPKNEAPSIHVPMVEEMHNLEFEFEDILKKKIQAEVEYLIITRTTRSWKIMAEDRIALLEEEKSIAGDQAQIMRRLRDAEDNAIRLKEQAGESEAHCSKLLQTEKVLKMQNKVCKFAFSCFIQLLLLCVAFGLFLIRLVPPSEEIVPT